MKIKSETDCKLTARVTYAEGSDPVVRLTATAVYDDEGTMSTSVDLDVPEELGKQIKALLDKAFAGCAPQLKHKINDAISTSRGVGKRLGEIK